MDITRISGAEPWKLAHEIDMKLKGDGISCIVSTPTSSSIRLQECRLTDDYIKRHGYNISPYSGRRGRILNWDNWVTVNNTINNVLDKHDVSANASSLHGTFKIRKGKKAFTDDDWQHLARQNVGSVMQPVSRRNAWMSEGI